MTASLMMPPTLMAKSLVDAATAIYHVEKLSDSTQITIRQLRAHIVNKQADVEIEIAEVKAYMLRDSIIFDSLKIPPYRVLILDSNDVRITCFYSYASGDSMTEAKCLQADYLLKDFQIIKKTAYERCTPVLSPDSAVVLSGCVKHGTVHSARYNNMGQRSFLVALKIDLNRMMRLTELRKIVFRFIEEGDDEIA